MKYDKKAIGHRIKTIRQSLGLTLEQFGSIIDDSSKSNVSKWEHGVSIPNNERLKLIATLGKMSINELLYGDLKARIKKVVLNNNKEIDDNIINLTSNFFVNTDNMNPTDEKIINRYDETVEMIKEMADKKTSETLLAINIRLAEDLILNFFDDITEDERKEYATKVMNELAEASINYETIFYKTTDEVYNEYMSREKSDDKNN